MPHRDHTRRAERLEPGKSRWLWTWFRGAAGLLLLIYILRHVDLRRAGQAITGRTLEAFLIAVLALVVAQLVSAERWRQILGRGAPTWSYLARLYLIGTFFSIFLPSSVGGDAVRAAATGRATGRGAAAVSGVLLDRLLGVVALFAYLALGLVLYPTEAADVLAATQWSNPWLPGLGVAGAALLVGLLLRGRLRGWLEQGTEIARALLRDRRRLVRASSLSLVVQGIYVLTWMELAHAFGLGLPPALFLLAVPVVSLAAMLPVTLSGIGVREGAWLLLLSHTSLSAAEIVTFSLSYFFAFVATGLIGGLVFMAKGTAPNASAAAQTVDGQEA